MEDNAQPRADRLHTLRASAPQTRTHSKKHAAFLKIIRITLPLVALALIILLFSWSTTETTPIKQTAPEHTNIRTTGKNELLNPRFENTDEQGLPYIITAKRALQGQSEEDDLILLESPQADITLKEDHWLAIKAAQSAFQQKTQRLLLKGDVEVFHDEGYSLHTQKMDVDMKAGLAKTTTHIHVQGPKGTLDATGMNADRNNGILIFKGPATLTLKGGDL